MSDPQAPSPMDPGFPLPERACRADGQSRLVGFELEFAGLSPDGAADAIQEVFGGEVRRESRFVNRVCDTAWGEFKVEVDARVLKERSYRSLLTQMGFNLEPETLDNLDEQVLRLASTVVPVEVVTPPVPVTEAGQIESLREALRRRLAQGTRAGLMYAFGLHLNPELPDLEVDTLRSTLQAYLLLLPWLKWRDDTDAVRRLTPFIQDFPAEYVRQVLRPGYRPDQHAFIRDFLAWNTTRNRSLDLLPLLTHLDRDQVRRALPDDPLTQARPTWHYRLPNCLVDDPDWRIARPWVDWLMVERLAGNGSLLEQLISDWLARGFSLTDQRWIQHVDRCLARSGR
ncbi:amidoligase family protein [Alkalispirillum mobile]|nr:amidoligase family protein [Alkalispirillum mobile]